MGACIWEEDDSGSYHAQCNKQVFQFNDYGPHENGFKFCPYCGKPLTAIPYCEDYDEDE